MESLMTIFEIADITKIKVATLRKYVARDAIPYRKLGAAVRFRPSEIDAWIESKARGEFKR
jgi:excisionase family DNA binding protein